MKRNLYWLATLMLLLALVAFSSGIANAEATPAADFEYTVNDGSVTITKYTGSAADVVIPDTLDSYPVTAIGNEAFIDCSDVETVAIPASVTRIGTAAFSQVPISAVNVAAANETYASIDGVLFNKACTTLVYYPSGRSGAQYPTYTVPDSVTEIGENAFLQSLVHEIILPSSVTEIGKYAFSQCGYLTGLDIPAGVTSIKEGTFYACWGLKHITLPEGITSIGQYAFDSCTQLSSLSLPVNLSSIGGWAITECSSLTDIYYPGTAEQWAAITIGEGNDSLTSATIHYNSSGPLFPAPVVSVQHGTLRQDMTVTVTSTEDAEVVIEISPDGYDDEFYYNVLPGGTNTITIHGWELTDFDSFTLTAASLLRETNESGEEEWSYGERTETRIVLEAPDQELTELPAMTFSAPEGKSGELTMTVEGAEAIAYLAIYEGLGGGHPDEYHDGSTVTLEAEGGDFGRYEIYCWARFSGLWYWVNSGEVTILPSGELAVPAVSLNGQTLTRNTLQTVALADPMTLAASCAKADSISYQVAKVNGSFDMSLVHFTEDGSYMELTSSAGMDGWDDNEYDETESFWMGRSGSTSSINILDQLTLVPGDYRVMITAYSDDSGIKKGQFVTWLRIPPTSGTCGESLTWALNDGTLTISGTGDMFDYDWNTGAPWKDASAEIHTVVIENGVTGIGDYAFRSCTALTSVTLPEGITRIGDAAFMRCSALADVALPSTLKIIGPSAFESTGVQEITLYDGLTSIGEYAFMNSALRKINIPAGTATKSEVFFVHNWQKDKDELIRVTVPESVTDLDVSDFFGTFLPAVEPGFVTPADLTTIESEAFSGIKASYIWLTDNVQSIGANAFSGCTSLQYIRIPNNCTSFGANAFPAGTILLVDYNADAYDALEAAGYTNIMQLVEGFNG